MAIFFSIKPGESRNGCTGATRRTVRLAVDTAGQVVTIDDRKINLAPDTLVLWHDDSAGTFHGVMDPVELQTRPPRACQTLTVGRDIKGVMSTSGSGGGDVAALVAKVERPLAVVTSGYRGRRGWSLLLVTPDGKGGAVSQKITPDEYRAKFAPVESL